MDKENVAPLTSSDAIQQKDTLPSPKKAKKRSRSIGPGGLEELEPKKETIDLKNRRKSAFPIAAKGILPSKDDEERKAARRKSLAARRVSFAPEATLHTWDVIFDARSEHTTSTDSSDTTRRSTRSSGGGSPFKQSPAPSSDGAEPPSTPPEQEDTPTELPPSPAPQRDLHQKQRRRSSTGIPPLDFNNPEDDFSSSGVSGSSDASGSESEEEDEAGSEDETGTAMSLDVGDNTAQSVATSEGSSTSSTLERNLRAAAEMAGTRGIDYDEHGDMSMELAGDEVTNAFQPWAQRAATQAKGSADMDQENVNPFSPAFKAQLVSGMVTRASTIMEEDEQDMSMDVTKAVGGIVKPPQVQEPASSPLGEGTMDITRAVGRIHSSAPESSPTQSVKKRRLSTTEAGSPRSAISTAAAHSKRRRSSVARSSMGDDAMDLTIVVGGIQSTGSPAKTDRRKSSSKRRSSGVVSEQDEATMDLTRAVGGIQSSKRLSNDSYDEPSEFSMELTTALGSIRPVVEAAQAAQAAQAEEDVRPVTPHTTLSPAKEAATTTPKDQQHFYNARDSEPKKLLTPLFQKVQRSAEKSSTKPSPLQQSTTYPVLPEADAEAEAEASPADRVPRTPDVDLQQQLLDAQLRAAEPSPSVQKQIRDTPVKPSTPVKHATPVEPATPVVSTPQRDGTQTLADSLKLMGTPRKETLKAVTPRKQTLAEKQPTPRKMMTPKVRPPPTPKAALNKSPERQLTEDIARVQFSGKPAAKIRLNDFLDMANIKFMDLTTTKRRLTTAPTPSKARRLEDAELGAAEGEPEVTLESGVVAAACTIPELEMFQHACRELKQYTSEGKTIIKELEAATYKETPPFMQAYLAANPARKAELDAHLRDMKTHARLRSKETWYAWRGQLLDDLMKGLQGIGEGLIKDDDTLQQTEQVLQDVLPRLLEQRADLQQERETLEEAALHTSEEEKEELETARERLTSVDAELDAKRRLLEELQRETHECDDQISDLQETKDENEAAIREAERVRVSCRSISLDEIAHLHGTYSSHGLVEYCR